MCFFIYLFFTDGTCTEMWCGRDSVKAIHVVVLMLLIYCMELINLKGMTLKCLKKMF